MQRLDLQFYAFFMVTLSGVLLGLLFDLLRVARRHFQPHPIVGAGADLLFWSVATVALSTGLYYGNWGELRFYVLLALLLGVGLYFGLASPFVIGTLEVLIGILEWLAGLLRTLVLRLVWAPLLAAAGLLWAVSRVLWRWAVALLRGVVDAFARLFGWLATPFIGPYRWLRLHYLLTKRRIKRRLRHWLLGPPRPRR